MKPSELFFVGIQILDIPYYSFGVPDSLIHNYRGFIPGRDYPRRHYLRKHFCRAGDEKVEITLKLIFFIDVSNISGQGKIQTNRSPLTSNGNFPTVMI
jgi:hypothetical protein